MSTLAHSFRIALCLAVLWLPTGALANGVIPLEIFSLSQIDLDGPPFAFELDEAEDACALVLFSPVCGQTPTSAQGLIRASGLDVAASATTDGAGGSALSIFGPTGTQPAQMEVETAERGVFRLTGNRVDVNASLPVIELSAPFSPSSLFDFSIGLSVIDEATSVLLGSYSAGGRLETDLAGNQTFTVLGTDIGAVFDGFGTVRVDGATLSESFDVAGAGVVSIRLTKKISWEGSSGAVAEGIFATITDPFDVSGDPLPFSLRTILPISVPEPELTGVLLLALAAILWIRPRHSRAVPCLALFGVFAMGVPSGAMPLQPIESFVLVNCDGPVRDSRLGDTPGTLSCDNTIDSGTDGTAENLARAATFGGRSPMATAETNANSLQSEETGRARPASATAQASISYAALLVPLAGAPDQLDIPVEVRVRAETSGSGAGASVVLGNLFSAFLSGSDDLDRVLDLRLRPGRPLRVDLGAGCRSSVVDGSAGCQALADPVFSLDQAEYDRLVVSEGRDPMVLADLYAFEFSPGLVPEAGGLGWLLALPVVLRLRRRG
ncbi:MAG: hypothetical protein QNK05_12960 [Myxococcota bacterium]|nr:hypothetical protein [Myxococcota bacterium]